MRKIALLLLILVSSLPAFAMPRDVRLQAVRNFSFAIGDTSLARDYVSRLGKFDLVIVDGEGTSKEQIAELRSRGVIVLGYLSVGTIESYRSWYQAAKPYRLEFWDDWGEWIADTSNANYRGLIVKNIAPMIMNKGFDGLFLDNFAIIEDHPELQAGMYAIVKALGKYVHRRKKFLFTQNGEDFIAPVLRYLDGWNREDVTSTYDFDRRKYVRVPAEDRLYALQALATFAQQGLLVTATDYVSKNSSAVAREAAANACSVRALPYLSNISLSRFPKAPFDCN